VAAAVIVEVVVCDWETHFFGNTTLCRRKFRTTIYLPPSIIFPRVKYFSTSGEWA
jgi:hypothetical protein